jgi:dTDP-glucose pyrophosphorylase
MKNLIIDENQQIINAINRINFSKYKVLFVVNSKKKLVGSISSGDIRRAIRKKINMHDCVNKIMCKKPKYLIKNETIRKNKKYLIVLPVINKKREIIDFIFSSIIKKKIENSVFLMAGGKGIRLMPLTQNTPKPLLKIKGVPIIEKIIRDFKKQGFYNFIISVNYLGHKIKKYLGDGTKFKVNIIYINEKKYLGTAGSLSFLDLNKTKFPIIVANSDLISEIDYNNLINYHHKKKGDLTICAKTKSFEMPYGEIILNNIKVKKIVEKPILHHLVNAGVYVINKSLIKSLPINKRKMMNDFITLNLLKKKKILSYPIYEKWIDIGNKLDFSKAK